MLRCAVSLVFLFCQGQQVCCMSVPVHRPLVASFCFCVPGGIRDRGDQARVDGGGHPDQRGRDPRGREAPDVSPPGAQQRREGDDALLLLLLLLLMNPIMMMIVTGCCCWSTMGGRPCSCFGRAAGLSGVYRFTPTLVASPCRCLLRPESSVAGKQPIVCEMSFDDERVCVRLQRNALPNTQAHSMIGTAGLKSRQ